MTEAENSGRRQRLLRRLVKDMSQCFFHNSQCSHFAEAPFSNDCSPLNAVRGTVAEATT